MRAICLTILSLAAHPAAGDISLVQPIACNVGYDCHIQQFVDHDAGPGTTDFACGTLTYDGHKGTDFALPSVAAQAAGVDVLAAADGIVRGVRNDMVDVLQGSGGAPDVSDRECGNGIVLDHGNGYETQYCHMATGSVSVAVGENVISGQPIGKVGLSGQTEFPHLHLSVRKDGETIDPFDPDGRITCDATDPQTLWITPPDTPAGGIISTGWATGVPEFDAIKAGTAENSVFTQNASGLVLWVYVFGGRAGDRMTLSLRSADGTLEMFETVNLDRTQAQLFRAVGRRKPDDGWPVGPVFGEVTLLRDGQKLDSDATIALIIAP